MSARAKCTPWKLAMGRPNCFRVEVYVRHSSSAPSARPRDRAAMPIRPPSNVCRNCRNPLFTGPRTFSLDRKSTRLNSSHMSISYAVFCLKKKIKPERHPARPPPRRNRISQCVVQLSQRRGTRRRRLGPPRCLLPRETRRDLRHRGAYRRGQDHAHLPAAALLRYSARADPSRRHGHSHDLVVFFFNDTPTTEIYTLSLHDALPISDALDASRERGNLSVRDKVRCRRALGAGDRKSTRLNSSHMSISYAVFCLK